MSYRDDHDAALSRIAALEQELATARDAARASTERDGRVIAMLERELAELRRADPDAPAPRRVRPSAPPPPARVSTPPTATAIPVDELAHRGPVVSRLLLAVLVLLTAGAAVLGFVLVRDDHRERSRTTCTLSTSPPHAQVFGITRTGDVDLGPAPVELAFDAWAAYDKVQLRLPGFDTLTIDPPATPGACPTDAYDLPPR